MIIYKATNKLNGKCYIGQTRHPLEYRKARHLACARKGVKTKFYCALRKYGEDSFDWEVICTTNSKDRLNELETFYITRFDSIKHGYNMVDGGDNNIMDIESVKTRHDEVMRSEEIRRKISATMKQKIADGKFFTEAHRKRLSERAKGNHNFGTGDTRSIPCGCIDRYLGRMEFKNYKEAGLWWFNTYHPFGETYSEATYQRKIKDCIKRGYCTYRKPNHMEIRITEKDIRWFRK